MSLADLPIPPMPKNIKVADLIVNIPGTIEFQKVVKRVNVYPPNSMTSSVFRALTYILIRLLRPQSVVEIGTMYAGTAELFASALLANGQGLLTTIDPFGADRAPAIINSWPSELRRFVEFRPINSMQLLDDLVVQQQHPDIIFVDGNHSYEYALFDLLAAARIIRRQGVIIMDNYDSPGVVGACATFEAANPAWQPIRFCAHSAFGSRMDRITLDALYRIYVAPATIAVGNRPVEFFSGNLPCDGVRGFRLELAEPSPGGRLHYQAYLRVYPWVLKSGPDEIEELSGNGSVAVPAGDTDASVSLSMPLVTSKPLQGYNRRVDIALLFEGSPRPGDVPASLMLAAEPLHDLIAVAPAESATSQPARAKE